MPALYIGLIALGLVDCLAPLVAHLAGGPIPLARDLALLPLIGAFLLSALAYQGRPYNRAVRRLFATAVATLTALALGHILSAFYLRNGLPAWAWIADAADLFLQQLCLAGWVALLALFPDGKYQSRYERLIVQLVIAGAVLVPLVMLVVSPTVPGDGVFLWSGRQPASPLYVSSVSWLQPTLPLPVAPLIGVVLLGLRYLRSRSRDLLWPLVTVSLFISLPAANGAYQFGLLNRDVVVGLILIVLPVVIASLAIGLVRFHLFDVELVIRRSLIYGIAWATIALIYAGLAAGFGLAIAQRYQVAVAILVAIAATIVFQPARVWLERIADRLVYGQRLERYELIRQLGAAFDQTLELESVGPRLAQTVGDGFGALWSEVFIGRDGPGGPTFEKVGQSGLSRDRREPVLVQRLTHAGELVGKIEVGGAAQGEYRAEDRELLVAIGQQAALAIRNARLAAELAASRARLVQAQEAERRRVERDLHDGVQQQLVSLVAGIRSARTRLLRDPDQTEARLSALQEEAHQALKDLRRVVSGIHPAVLEDHGLVAAVKARISRLPIDVEFECSDELSGQRFSEEVESAAYFVVCEALTNVLKHSGSNAARVKLTNGDDHLRVEVRDRGRGFNLGATHATGLQGLRDRVEALGGSLKLDSSPGSGTCLSATLNISNGQYV